MISIQQAVTHGATPAPDQVHIYLTVGTDRLDVLARQKNVLVKEERDRAGTFAFPDDRTLYVASHVLLRQSLSRHSNILPADWRFAKESKGRPIIDRQSCPNADDLKFSLAHTAGLACCVVAKVDAVGIDVERIRAVDRVESISRHIFSQHEASDIINLPVGLGPQTRTWSYFEYWTLKEAYLKAIGVGLENGMSDCRFRIHRNALSPRIEFVAPANSKCGAGNWGFFQAHMSQTWMIAIAVKAPNGAQISINWVPASAPAMALDDPSIGGSARLVRTEEPRG